MLCNISLNTPIACSIVCFPGMTSSLAKVNKSSGAHFLALFLKFPNFLMFLNIQINLLILKTYYGQFTLTTNKSLLIIFNSCVSYTIVCSKRMCICVELTLIRTHKITKPVLSTTALDSRSQMFGGAEGSFIPCTCRRRRWRKIQAQAWRLCPPLQYSKNMIQYFETISNKLHFDIQFLEFRHDNRKLFPDYSNHILWLQRHCNCQIASAWEISRTFTDRVGSGHDL